MTTCLLEKINIVINVVFFSIMLSLAALWVMRGNFAAGHRRCRAFKTGAGKMAITVYTAVKVTIALMQAAVKAGAKKLVNGFKAVYNKARGRTRTTDSIQLLDQRAHHATAGDEMV